VYGVNRAIVRVLIAWLMLLSSSGITLVDTADAYGPQVTTSLPKRSTLILKA